MATSTEIASGVRIYRAAEAPLLSESGTTTTYFEAAPEVQEVATRLSTTDCSINKILAHQGEGEGDRMSVVYLYFKPNFPLFPHKHDVNSMYVVISGSVVDFMGTETLRPGDCWSVEAGHSYEYSAGPDGVEVLEIFSGRDQVSIILTDAAADRLVAAEEAVRQNEGLWKTLTEGPLFKANAGKA
jgi:mannose-6-phosphate isomerase-like protein (cupin superfamily)